MLSPKDSPRGKLLSQYVCARIIRLDNVDLGLFDWDRHNTLYYFILNADEQIYMRYGGRDSQSQDSYLNLESIELALRQGLELHKAAVEGKLPKAARPKPMFARDFPLLVERTFARNQCVECHLTVDFQNLHREQDGTLDKLTHLYRSPDIKTIGIHLDIPKGLVVKQAGGAVAAAGMKAGDRITALEGSPVWTFGDLQYRYDKVDRRSSALKMTVERDGAPVELSLALPLRWWWTDVRYRQSSVEPRLYFECQPAGDAARKQYGLKPDGFACEVSRVDAFAQAVKSHELKLGDLVVAVDGVESDPLAHTAELYMKLHKTPGDSAQLDIVRDGKRIRTNLKTYRLSFRK